MSPFHLVSLDEVMKNVNSAKRKLKLDTVRTKPTTIAVEKRKDHTTRYCNKKLKGNVSFAEKEKKKII